MTNLREAGLRAHNRGAKGHEFFSEHRPCRAVCRRSTRSRPSRPPRAARASRERQPPQLTDAARDYLAVVRDALDRIALGTERLVQWQTSGALTVSTSPDFSAKWLVYRLSP